MGDVGRAAVGFATGGISEVVRDDGIFNEGLQEITGSERWQPTESGFKAQQQQLANILKQRIEGDRPSVAEEQLKQGLDQTLSDQVSALRSAPGVSPALQARMIQQAGQDQATDLARAQAVLRAGEQTEAERSLAGTLSSARGQDQGFQSLYGKGFESAQGRRGQLFRDVSKGAANFALGGGLG